MAIKAFDGLELIDNFINKANFNKWRPEVKEYLDKVQFHLASAQESMLEIKDLMGNISQYHDQI